MNSSKAYSDSLGNWWLIGYLEVGKGTTAVDFCSYSSDSPEKNICLHVEYGRLCLYTLGIIDRKIKSSYRHFSNLKARIRFVSMKRLHLVLAKTTSVSTMRSFYWTILTAFTSCIFASSPPLPQVSRMSERITRYRCSPEWKLIFRMLLVFELLRLNRPNMINGLIASIFTKECSNMNRIFLLIMAEAVDV